MCEKVLQIHEIHVRIQIPIAENLVEDHVQSNTSFAAGIMGMGSVSLRFDFRRREKYYYESLLFPSRHFQSCRGSTVSSSTNGN